MEKSRPKIEKSFLRLNKIINIIILFVRLFYFQYYLRYPSNIYNYSNIYNCRERGAVPILNIKPKK